MSHLNDVEIVRTSRDAPSNVVVTRHRDGIVRMLASTADWAVQVHFTASQWNDFLRTANADAAKFQWSRGPYAPPPPEPKRIA